jgi:soluble lytic murein transglycosylase
MSSHAARRRVARRPTRARVRRRRLAFLAGAVVLGALLAALVTGLGPDAVRELALPLRHDDIIRQQARDKNLDPALIAAVIYAESRFRDQESHAGALGLMQVRPQTAHLIARQSGGTQFVTRDLADPEINIRYGSYYLRYLMRRYAGNVVAALAAYNAGMGNVDRWGGSRLDLEAIRFVETRAYVEQVLDKRREYRDKYAEDLGLRG